MFKWRLHTWNHSNQPPWQARCTQLTLRDAQLKPSPNFPAPASKVPITVEVKQKERVLPAPSRSDTAIIYDHEHRDQG